MQALSYEELGFSTMPGGLMSLGSSWWHVEFWRDTVDLATLVLRSNRCTTTAGWESVIP